MPLTHGPLSSVLPRVQAQLAHFFPDASDIICFADDDDSVQKFMGKNTPPGIRMRLAREIERLKKTDKTHRSARHYCARIHEDPVAFRRGDPTPHIWLMHVDELYLEQGDLGLISEPRMIAELIAWHEAGHALQAFYRHPLEMDASEMLSFGEDPVAEQFSEGFAAMMLIRNHGASAIGPLQTLADIRIKQSLQMGNHTHYTTPIIDRIVGDWLQGKPLPPVADIPQAVLAMTSMDLVTEGERLRNMVRTQEGLEGKDGDRIFTALDRTFRLSTPARQDYINRNDLQITTGPISDRTVDFLQMFGFPVIESVSASKRAYDYFATGKRADDNMFPGLTAHICRKTAGGIVSKFQWLAAAQSPDFINGILESYYAQMAYEKIGRLLQVRDVVRKKPPVQNDPAQPRRPAA